MANLQALKVAASSFWKEIRSLLFWCMLAANTIGPGSVVTCSRAGAEYGFSLVWTLIFASILSYTLQEGSARLTIVSGKSFGQCLRLKYRHGATIHGTAIICWAVAAAVFAGNILFECNCFAGGIDAVFSIPQENWPYVDRVGLPGDAWRIGLCISYGIIVLGLLFWDKVERLGQFLGIILVAMVLLFLIVVCMMTLDIKELLWGFLPNIPAKSSPTSAEPSDLIISLVGTTSAGFNLFLGGAMARGRDLGPAQRGILFSTIGAMVASMLILIVGAGTFTRQSSQGFTVDILATLIQEYIGIIGVYVFSIGFIAAAVSSMLTTPLGAALTAESVFAQSQEELQDKTDFEEDSGEVKGNNDEFIEQSAKIMEDETKMLESRKSMVALGEESFLEERLELKTLPRWVYWIIMTSIVLVAVVIISCNAPRVYVILVAQVFNGCLLPLFSICLLLCLNDDHLMKNSPQKSWANVFLYVSVSITVFLTANVLIQKMLGSLLVEETARLVTAAATSVVVMATVTFRTSLAKDLRRSFTFT